MSTARLRLGRTPLIAQLIRLTVAGAVAESGYLHAKLYIDGYRFVPHIGTMFLIQAAVSFAAAALLLFAGPRTSRIHQQSVAHLQGGDFRSS